MNGDVFSAFEFYQKCCNKNSNLGCVNLYNMYRNGLGVRQDFKKAIGVLEDACNKDDNLSCVSLGLVYQEGKIVKQDFEKAQELFSKECNRTNALACHSLAELFINNSNSDQNNINKNVNKALESFKTSCELGMSDDCIEVAMAYTNGVYVEQNLTAAKEYFGKACDQRNSNGCESYKLLNEDGF